MPKFSGTNRRPLRANLTAPIRTLRRPTLTHEGGAGFLRDAESELFLLAATNMVGEDTFYERADKRDARYVDLVHAVTSSNPAFLAGADADGGKVGLAQYLRTTLKIEADQAVLVHCLLKARERVKGGGMVRKASGLDKVEHGRACVSEREHLRDQVPGGVSGCPGHLVIG